MPGILPWSAVDARFLLSARISIRGPYFPASKTSPEVSYSNGLVVPPLQSSSAQPNDSSFAEQWSLRNTGQSGGQYGSDINITTAWQTTTGTPSKIIAVIDALGPRRWLEQLNRIAVRIFQLNLLAARTYLHLIPKM
jgi:hypothetical protein